MSEKKEKDFLEQFSSNGTPDSFKEEDRQPIQKEKKPFPTKLLIGLVTILIILFIGIYFLFLAPKIEMPDFVGQSQDDVAAWIKQNGISSQGIVMKKEYSFDYDEGQVIEQDVAAGKKVKKDVKITFIVSDGADPQEKISLPDIKSMNKTELENWIKENKLSKTKITTSYSDDIEEGEVISFDLKGTDPSDFTRSTVLNISISKGKQPANQIKVEDFSGKTSEYVESWAKTNKIELIKQEDFSSTVASGLISYQSVAANKTISQGETLTVTVSKGKGIKVPDFSKMSKEEVADWANLNKVTLSSSERYASQSSSVISQEPKAGSMMAEGENIKVIFNLGNTFYADDVGIKLVGNDYNKLVDKLNELRSKGIDAYASNWTSGDEIYSATANKGQILSVKCTGKSDGKSYACDARLPLDVRFDVVICKGKIYEFTNSSGNSVSNLIDDLSAKMITFKLDNNIKDSDFAACAKVVNADRSELSDNFLYEDREYLIILTGGVCAVVPTDTPASTPTPVSLP